MLKKELKTIKKAIQKKELKYYIISRLIILSMLIFAYWILYKMAFDYLCTNKYL